MKKFLAKAFTAIFGITLLLFTAASCAAGDHSSIVNIGMTYPLASFNPLHIDASESMKYAVGISFEPLMELNDKLEFQGILAESVEPSQDLKNYTVKLKLNANWSDGKPITVDDVIFFILQTTSKSVANVSMANFYLIDGFDESGQVEDNTKNVKGLEKIDDKTMIFHAVEPISPEAFNNTFMRYIFPIPSHILGDKTSAELAVSEWFNTAEVVSGPFRPTKVDLTHYVTFEKNPKYWQGDVKLNNLNIKIVSGDQLYSGLETSEIDFVQQTTGVFAEADMKSIEALENVDAVYDKPITSVYTFLNNETISEPKVRQAILHGIDRELLVKEFLKGNGEVVDGFLTSASNYFDPNLAVTKYDAALAKKLVEEAKANGWKQENPYVFKIDSGDSTFALAATVIVQQLQEIGIQAKIQTLPLNQLLTDAGKHNFDLMAVQYTLPPAAPALDIAWLTGQGNWSNYQNAEVDALNLQAGAFAGSAEDGVKIYSAINARMQEDVPMINMYALAPLGAKSKRLQAPNPTVFGSFIDLYKWEIVK